MAQQDQAHEQEQEQDYQPRDAVGNAIKALGITGGAGLLIASVQNTLNRQNIGAFGVFTRFGGTAAMFAAMGGAYEFTKSASANLREKDDAYNSAVGGWFAGSLLGLRFRSAPAVIGYGSLLAVVLGAFTFTGGHLSGFARDKDVDEVGRKEYMRKNRRRPLEDTVNELGEGRGIYAPGYAERRAERIWQAYGIDVTNPQPAVGLPPTQ